MTIVLKFSVGYDGTNNEWEDGARISTPFLSVEEMTLDKTKRIRSVEFDVNL